MTMQSGLSVAGAATLQYGLTLKTSWAQVRSAARKLVGSVASSGDDGAGGDDDYEFAAPPVAVLTVEAADGKGAGGGRGAQVAAEGGAGLREARRREAVFVGGRVVHPWLYCLLTSSGGRLVRRRSLCRRRAGARGGAV